MLDHQEIYLQEGERYHRLVEREDYQNNLLTALLSITNLEGLNVIDLGAGTGRLSSLLAPLVSSIAAFDLSTNMLEVAKEQLLGFDQVKWLVAAADHRWIPLQSQCADLIISGWSFCYLALWGERSWKKELNQGLGEIKRLSRENGKVIIIESLGTGNTEPVMIDKLSAYLEYLEERGFQRTWIRTDYRFRDLEEAEELTEFFFGEEMLKELGSQTQPILPECTGIWQLPANLLK
jgi:ubiquinone/menaquinone biosynthesis C-methylase UbiE